MATNDPRPRPAADIVEPGVPATEEVPENPLRTGDTKDVGDMPAPDQPLGSASWGTTANEEARGEPLEVRLMQEEPDVIPAAENTAGLLYESDLDDGTDDEAHMVADEDANVDDALAPEEAAMHITTDPPGATTDADPGYLDR